MLDREGLKVLQSAAAGDGYVAVDLNHDTPEYGGMVGGLAIEGLLEPALEPPNWKADQLVFRITERGRAAVESQT